ncbi:MAG: TIGR00282 family metallophosphoesterase [Chthonomonadales bacterium]|nr:TIGR00282 family metallophosphoesterase [Chthonomonadales bacterium]
MRLLMVGDIVGRPGRTAAHRLIPALRREHGVDFVVANAENAAGGIGITREIAVELLEQGGVDVVTLGNHAWAKREVYGYLDGEPRVLRPVNYPPGAPGHGHGLFQTPAGPVGVAVVQGRVFMEAIDDPFRAADAVLADLRRAAPIVLVDLHAEATSEKQAIGWYVDGRATAVLGTHTHVQTADERVLPNGTAYITDVGMTGPIDSVIGMSRETVLARFTTSVPTRFEVADGPARLCAVLVEADAGTGRALRIERIQVMSEGK